MINHVSDTAIWVAQYRAIESERPDALFRDDLAKALVGTRGKKIAAALQRTSRYTQWSVVIRTVVIDQLIQKLAANGVDTVINLGAGLDARPYRLKLPASLRWIEVDYASIIEHKQKILESEKPGVELERIVLDLANVEERKALFARLNSQSRSCLVLTEGVIPYLTEDQVASLAKDLRAENNFHFWLAEYISSDLYRYFQTSKRMQHMKNAPFRFFPANWFEFFQAQGWRAIETRYLPEEGKKMGRPMPLPWWGRILHRIMSPERSAEHLRKIGYVVHA